MRKFEDVDVNPEFEAFEAVAHSHGYDTIRWKFPRTSREAIRRMLTPDDFIEDSSED